MLHILKNINKEKFYIYLGLLYENNQLKKEFNEIKNVKIINFKKKSKYDLSIYFRISKFAEKNKIDIIQTFLGNHHSYIPSLINGKTIAIGGIRGTHDKEFSPLTKFNEFTIPKKLTKLNKFNLISNSEAAKKLYIKKGFPENKINVIPNGIDVAYFSKGNKNKIIKEFSLKGKTIIGIVARLVKEKNHEMLLECFAKLTEMNKNLKLLIIGDGPERKNLEKKANELKIKNNVIFTGNRRDIRDFLHTMDIFVLPSKSEGWPNVVGEAMAAGLPVIAFPAGDIPEIINNNVTGIISEPNKDSFLKHLNCLITNESKRKKLSINAKKYINKFKINNMVKFYEKIYSEMINKGKNKWTTLNYTTIGFE